MFGSTRAPVQRAFEEILLGQPPSRVWALGRMQRDPAFQARYRVAYRQHLAATQGVSEACIAYLQTCAIILPLEAGDALLKVRLADERAAAQRERPEMTDAEVTEWLDIDATALDHCLTAGVCKRTKTGQISRHSVEVFLGQLLQQVRHHRASRRPWPFQQVPLFAHLDTSGPELLAAIVAGQVQVDCREEISAALSTLCIAADKWDRAYITLRRWRTLSEVAQEWHVPTELLSVWIQAKLLQAERLPSVTAWHFVSYLAPATIAQWQTQYLLRHQAASRLGLPLTTIADWIRQDKLVPTWHMPIFPLAYWVLPREAVLRLAHYYAC